MNSFKCFLCFSEFSDSKIATGHLQKEHCVKEKVNKIKCIVKNGACNKTFQTWSGLKKHIKTCVEIAGSEEKIDDIAISTMPIQIYEPDTQEDIQCNKIPIVYNSVDFDDHQHEYSTPENIKPLRCYVESGIEDFHLRMTETLRKFASNIEKLAATHQVKNSIFILVEQLLTDAHIFNWNSIKNTPSIEESVLEVLSAAHDEFLNGFRKFDTRFKREKIYEANELYFKSKEMAIGTHWEIKRDKHSQKVYPNHVQSGLQYVSITDTLKSLFRRDDFKKMYFDYNSASTGQRHICVPGNFRDFCCGKIYKDNDSFKNHPESIQIQIFTDGFEFCDGLKSKANLHSQVAFYFATRNLPQELAFNLRNIHLVAICNSHDIKTEHTDYNNVWSIIVHDLRELESTGIDIDGVKLKGDVENECLSL